jgi:hypothetical protein
VSVVFASIAILYLLTFIAVYCRERRAQSQTNIESQNEQESAGIQESIRKWVMKYHKKLRDRYRSTYQKSAEKRPFLGRLQERWFTWIGSHLHSPDGGIFRRIWRRNRQGSVVTMSTNSSEPAGHSWCINLIRRMREARCRNLNLVSSNQKIAGQHSSHKFWLLMRRVPNSMGEARADGDPVPEACWLEFWMNLRYDDTGMKSLWIGIIS